MQEYPPPILAARRTVAAGAVQPAAASPFGPTTAALHPGGLGGANEAALFPIRDPDMARENPVEAKHRRLVRSHRSGPLDRESKPNAKSRDELNEILSYPPTQPLAPAQLDELWRFRFYLARDKRALTKFLKSVAWSDPSEVAQAVDVLLPMWVPIEIEDALELLGPGEAFRDRRVRGYAVRQLARADDDELMLYLLQLVQALKFEPASSSSSSSRARKSASSSRSLVIQSLEDFLVERSVKSKALGNHFYCSPALHD